jgi:hypothetical protein
MSEQSLAQVDRLRAEPENQTGRRDPGDVGNSGVRQSGSRQLRAALAQYGHVEHRSHHLHHVTIIKLQKFQILQ